jgi:hypothetical protein
LTTAEPPQTAVGVVIDFYKALFSLLPPKKQESFERLFERTGVGDVLRTLDELL